MLQAGRWTPRNPAVWQNDVTSLWLLALHFLGIRCVVIFVRFFKWMLESYLDALHKRFLSNPYLCTSGVTRGGLGVSTPPPPKFLRSSKIVRNSTRLWKLLKIAEFRTPTPQDVRKKCSKILKLPSVRNCFTLAMTNKLVVIINSLRVPKIKKIWVYEMKFLLPNCGCLQNHWLGGYRPQIPVLSILNWICWTHPNKLPGYATALHYSWHFSHPNL